jgi:TonB family protein
LKQPKENAMRLNSRKVGLRWLATVLSISAVVFAAHANAPATKPVPNLSSSQAAADWERYAIKGGEFSVQLPTTPAVTTYESRPDPFSKIRIRYIIGAYSEGVAYAIYVAERKQSLEEYIGQSRYSSPNEYKRDVKIGEVSGKEYAFQDAGTKRVTQYFITKRYIYSFIVQGSVLGNPDIGIPRFFDSIQPNANGIPMVDGPGVQPIDAAATPPRSDARVITGKETTQKARVITKPEPTYTEDARKNQVTGTVVIRCVFTSSGAVTQIRVVSDLPHGLSDRAIAAARQIRFIPAIKDGHFVSMYIQLEYNFNLY